MRVNLTFKKEIVNKKARKAHSHSYTKPTKEFAGIIMQKRVVEE
jgi:hypothetical protein